jgi:NAD+ synthase (glutamine-hydrolysing)
MALLPPDKTGGIEQKTEDIIGPYELHDFFIYHFIKNNSTPEKIAYLACEAWKDVYSKDVVKKTLKIFLRRFFQQQFKRSCSPDGVQSTCISLSPRGTWQMPSDAIAKLWLK